MDTPATRSPTLQSVSSSSLTLFQNNLGPVLLLCTAGVGFDALLTYLGGFLTLGYGEPVFAIFSVVLQEVLYFGPAVLLWNGFLKARRLEQGILEPTAEDSILTVLLSGFSNQRAWAVAGAVTGLYMVGLASLLCIGGALGGVLLYWVPGALAVIVKVLRSVVGPVMGMGYLATALCVARPEQSVMNSMKLALKLMVSRPMAVGLMLGLGGFLEQLAGMTVFLGIVLDGYLLCYAAAAVWQLMDNKELE